MHQIGSSISEYSLRVTGELSRFGPQRPGNQDLEAALPYHTACTNPYTLTACERPDHLAYFIRRRAPPNYTATAAAVLEAKRMLDAAGITAQHAALCDAAKQALYNTSKFTLRDLKSRGNQRKLLADFEHYLNGYSANVQDILENFKFRNRIPTLSKSDSFGTLISKFLDPEIDLTVAGIDNHAMGTVFEEPVRKFKEENNEEAGQHWTARDAVRLMAILIFLPIADNIESGSYFSTIAPAAPAACSPSSKKPNSTSCLPILPMARSGKKTSSK